jgi:putative peptide maturation system protein
MAVITDTLLADALDYLRDLTVDRAQPPAALRRLEVLRQHHPGTRLRLLWQREEYDRSLHYDLLVRQPDEGTVSLSYCADDALPWPLRSRQRASERVLLRVNGVSMEVDRAVACLDFLWDEVRLADRLVTACLLQHEIEQSPVDVDEAELQQAMDAFRRAHGLLTVTATREWMARHSLSHVELDRLVAGEAAVARLRKREVGGDVPAYFEKNGQLFDTARIARMVLPSRAHAERVVAAVVAGADFGALAEAAFVDGTAAPEYAAVRRHELAPDIAGQVFGAAPGALLGPFDTVTGHALIRLLDLAPAVLDEVTTNLVERHLFAAWIAERRRSARVEWCWGDSVRTAAVGRQP